MAAQLASPSMRTTSRAVFSAAAERARLPQSTRQLKTQVLDDPRPLEVDDGPTAEMPWPSPSHVGRGHLFFFMR